MIWIAFAAAPHAQYVSAVGDSAVGEIIGSRDLHKTCVKLDMDNDSPLVEQALA